MILEYQPECIINTGIGGATSLETKIGDVVIATEVVQHDMDTTALGDAPAMLFLHNGEYDKIPCDKALSEKLFPLVKAVTQNQGLALSQLVIDSLQVMANALS